MLLSWSEVALQAGDEEGALEGAAAACQALPTSTAAWQRRLALQARHATLQVDHTLLAPPPRLFCSHWEPHCEVLIRALLQCSWVNVLLSKQAKTFAGCSVRLGHKLDTHEMLLQMLQPNHVVTKSGISAAMSRLQVLALVPLQPVSACVYATNPVC